MSAVRFEVPFHRPGTVGREMRYLEQAVDSGRLSGSGPLAEECSRLLEAELGAAKVLLTSSCTHALEMSSLLLDLGPGDEVIVPAFAFVSTANAFALRGAQPVFVDVRPDTLNLNEALVESKITRRTRAIVPLHYGGVACEMDQLLAVARDRGIAVLEDNALGLFGRYRGRALGTLGELGSLSFHGTKLLSCGEGGALLVNKPEWIERAEVLREKGTNRSSFTRGEVERYTWVDLGSSYLPSELQAAYLLAQLEERDEILAGHRRLWEAYRDGLAEWADRDGVQMSSESEPGASNCSGFHLLLRDSDSRDSLIRHLADRGVQAVFHYQPLHLSKMGREFGGSVGDCPVTESVASRLLRLPLYSGLTESDQQRVVEAVTDF